MTRNYSEYLSEEYKKAEAAFNEAKAETLREIEALTPRDAAEYGAAYYSRIERMTKAAASMKAIAEARSVYEYYTKKEA